MMISANSADPCEISHYAFFLSGSSLNLYNVNATLFKVEIAQCIVRTSLYMYMGVWLYLKSEPLNIKLV